MVVAKHVQSLLTTCMTQVNPIFSSSVTIRIHTQSATTKPLVSKAAVIPVITSAIENLLQPWG